jgi:hypothetical protein
MPARNPDALVREFIEKMSGDMLEDRYRAVLAELIRGHAGLYALYDGDRLYYVGLATDLMRRMKQHQTDRHAGAWDSFSVYLTERDEHIKPLESLLLRVFQPPGNGQRGKLPGAVDRRRELLASMRRQDAERRDAMFGKRPGTAVAEREARVRKSKITAGTSKHTRALTLRAQYKGRSYAAVFNKDGTVRHEGARFSSLSAAASSVTGRPTNGWLFWRYRDGRGEWRPVSELR